jgi:nickel/cobalt tolerance cation efflux system protein
MALRRLVEVTLKNQILAVPGVSQVTVYGGDERQEQVLIDPAKLRALNLSPSTKSRRRRPEPTPALPAGS